MLFDQPRQRESLWAVEKWARETTGGSLAEFPGVPEPGVWDRVCAEHGNCLGKKCEFYKPCFWQAAKRRMKTGNVLVVNHALFFSDLALRISGVNYLPKYDVVILDEAHTLEDVAGEHFGLKVSHSGLRYQLRVLYDARRGKGMLSAHEEVADDAVQDVVDLQDMTENFFARCNDWQKENGRANGRIHEGNFVENDLSPKLRDLSKHLKEMLSKLEKEEDISEINSASAKMGMLAEELDAIVTQRMPDAVYWMETGGRGGNTGLAAAPISVAAGLRTHLFEKLHSVTMCSATLCTAEAGASGAAATQSFKYIASRLGAESATTLVLGSPFDYAKQATLYIEADLPEPGDTPRFMPAACEKILHYLKETSGGAFVLFTSYGSLKDAAQRLADDLEALGFPLLVQGKDAPRKVLLDRFRATPNAVLFGTSSFWQGIDVRGDALRNVIIVKLPFAVPDEPVVEARLEMITRSGGNPFMEYSVPEAIIKLKQGFGRLIRSKTDRGIVVILDSRVKHKRYGKLFLDALPPVNVIVKTNVSRKD